MSDITFNSSVLEESEESSEVVPTTTIEQQKPLSTMEPAKETQKDIVEIAEKLEEATTTSFSTQTEGKNKLDDKKYKVKTPKNPFENLTPKVIELVYWENPIHSGALLAISLSSLIFIANYSLFNTFCALASILIGVNWVYVISRKQLNSLLNQNPINPHEHLLVDRPWYIERELVEKYLDVTIEAVNFVLLQVQRIVLVDDPMRTVKYVLTFYLLWTLGNWFSLRTLLGIGLILSFATPIAYQKNKDVIDEKLYQANKFFHSHLDRVLNIAKQHTGGMYEKAKTYATTKGLVNDPKKEE